MKRLIAGALIVCVTIVLVGVVISRHVAHKQAVEWCHENGYANYATTDGFCVGAGGKLVKVGANRRAIAENSNLKFATYLGADGLGQYRVAARSMLAVFSAAASRHNRRRSALHPEGTLPALGHRRCPRLGTAAGVVLRVGYSLGTSGTNKPYGSFPENAGSRASRCAGSRSPAPRRRRS